MVAAINYDCDWKSGFVMNPIRKQRVGYLTSFECLGLDENLEPDVEVFTPYNHSEVAYGGVSVDASTFKATCVGVIESFSFGGGVGDPLCISAYISSKNAERISSKLKTTLKSTVVGKLGWWVCNFDEEAKEWFEQAHPLDPVDVSGMINAPGGKELRIAVSSDPTKVAPNIDVNVYNIYFEVVPAANATFVFHFANSKAMKFAKNWGLKVGPTG